MTATTGQAIDPREWLAAQTEPTEAEAYAMARALVHHRDDAEALEALGALSPFERHLAELAYNAGAKAVREALGRVIGAAAATVHASALHHLDAPRLEFDHSADFHRGREGDPRAAAIVRRARRIAEHEAA